MHYSSALVLSTLAVGQATAASIHNRHASFHERRQVEAKRDAPNVDWSKVVYDLSGVDWSTVKYNLPGGQPTPTPSPAQQNPTPQASSQAAAAPAPAASSAAAKVQSTSGGFVADITQGVPDMIKKLSLKAGINSNANNGKIWLGESQWQTTFTNAASELAILACWTKDGYTGMFPMATPPQILAGIKPGEKLAVSFAPNVGSACAPIFPDTILQKDSGYIYSTWYEVTYPGGGGTGGFDITRIPNMHGRNIVAKGSQCTSDTNTCAFKCTADVDFCTYGYELIGCGAAQGGGGGFDAAMGGVGGGCTMSQGGENINVSLY